MEFGILESSQALFGQEIMVGEPGGEPAKDQVLGLGVGLCDQVDHTLKKDLSGFTDILPEQLPRFADDIPRRIQIGLVLTHGRFIIPTLIF